jgi:hypothetical protein
MPNLFSPNGNYLSADTSVEYDPGITPEIDQQIRHLPMVVGHCYEKALETLNSIEGNNFQLVMQNKPDTQRPRVYVVPRNNKGIHQELAEGVLLKAALGMEGK